MASSLGKQTGGTNNEEVTALKGLTVGSPSDEQVDLGDGDFLGGNQSLVVHGDLTVYGSSHTISSTVVEVADKAIELGKRTSSLKPTASDAFTDTTPTGGAVSGTINASQTNVNGKIQSVTKKASETLHDSVNNYNTHADYNGEGHLVIDYSTNGSSAITVNSVTSTGGFFTVGNIITVLDAGGGTFTLEVKTGGIIASGQLDTGLDGGGIILKSGESSPTDKSILWRNDTDAWETNQNFVPSSNNQLNLGDATHRWANVYTGDLHLANDRGDWTLVEEANYLTVTNNKNGKRFRLLMEELPEDED